MVRRLLVSGPVAAHLLIALTACTVPVQSSPTTFEVREGTVPPLRGQQELALKNAYGSPTIVVVEKMQLDLRQFTETAISLLGRQMTKDKITIDPSAAKSIVLRVKDPWARAAPARQPFVWQVFSSLTLEAEFANGTQRAFRVNNNSLGGGPRALDGAVLKAVIELLNDEQFLAYVNGY